MKLHFVDQDRDIATALEEAFRAFPEVSVSCGDILEVAEVCVVSPANSHGFMDGGVDAVYREYFGGRLEDRIRSAIAARPEGHLPIGASLVVSTDDAKIPFMIVAPTMEMPEAVSPLHAARAMHAVLRAQVAHAAILRSVFCPGLATGVGSVAPKEAAEAMASAYREAKKKPNQSTTDNAGAAPRRV